MSLSPLEQHMLAYYLDHDALGLSMVPRAWPYGELVLIIEDKVRFSMYPFGTMPPSAAATVARALLDQLIEREAFSTTRNSIGNGTMHRYQQGKYREVVEAMKAENSIIQRVGAPGGEGWAVAFQALSERTQD